MKSKFTTLLAGVTSASVVLLSGTAHAAGTASLSLSPASGSHDVNSTFSVGVYENGDSVNVVTVDLVYNTSQLQLIGESCGGAFATQASQSGDTITCFVPGGSAAVSGSQLAVNATFKAIAGSGTASVSFGSDSIIASNASGSNVNVWNGSTAGGSYSLTTPAPVSAPTTVPKSTPKTTSTNTPVSTGSSTATPAGNGAAATSTTGAGTSKTTSQKTDKHATTKPKTIKSHHTGIVTTSVVLLAALAAGFYWLVLRKRVEVAAAPAAYKLAGSKAKSGATKKAVASKATKSARKSTKKA